MLTAEYDYEMDIEVQREEAFENGKELGLKNGRESGLQEGEELGKHRLNQLYAKLIELNRDEDVIKAIQDADYREKLFQELKL